MCVYVCMQDRQEVTVEGPYENHIEYNDYVLVHGDPRTNGKGHTTKTNDRVWGVSVPGPNVRKIYQAQRRPNCLYM